MVHGGYAEGSLTVRRGWDIYGVARIGLCELGIVLGIVLK